LRIGVSTDLEWLKWGRQDPYFAVITDDRYRSAKIDEAARQAFFDSGRHHVHYVMDACRRLVGSSFAPARALDFGCGVGRVALPLAEHAGQVVGLDVSPEMLAEAQRNAERQGLRNIEWLLSDDTLSALQQRFDLVHSCITFQHIDVPRGRLLFARLVERLAPGGVGAVQITYAKAYHADSFGQPPVPAEPAAKDYKLGAAIDRLGRSPLNAAARDPEMQMNPYPLNELVFVLQTAGVRSFQAEFTDHGGELGLFLFFSKP